MKKYIYKITNLVNGKVYIGQTINKKDRWCSHKSKLKHNRHDNKHLQRAWNKYGKDNFTFEILEYTEDYNEAEKRYIRLYNSDNIIFGYNIMQGGDNPPIIKGEDSLLSKHTYEEISNLKYDLKNSDLNLEELSKKYKYDDVGSITRINNGDMWRDDEEQYPLRECYLTDDIIEYIINQLLNTQKSQKEIAKELGVARSTITMINIGKNNKRENINYPIRINTRITKKEDLDKNIIAYIINNPKLTLSYISKVFNISPSVISTINNGNRHKYLEYEYPIRK